MVSSTGQYRWSSDIYYRRNISGFINKDIVIQMLDSVNTTAMTKYIEFMDEKEETAYGKLNVIGDEAYRILCTSKKEVMQRKRLDEILFETGVEIDELELIKAGSRKRNLTEYKLRYAMEAIAEHYTLKEIGEHIAITSVSVKNMLDRYEGTKIT